MGTQISSFLSPQTLLLPVGSLDDDNGSDELESAHQQTTKKIQKG